MGIFNFWKPKQLEADSFDEIFEKAANDPAYRPLFYRSLLQAHLFVLTEKGAGSVPGKFITDGNTRLRVRTYKDGQVPIFSSRERILENKSITGETWCTQLKASVIFQMFSDKTSFILNPYSKVSKELLPGEIQQLSAGTLFESGELSVTKPGESILVRVPVDYPVNLVETLKRYFETRKEVKAAYLALIEAEGKSELPHLMIGIEIIGKEEEVLEEVGEVIKPYIRDNEPIDLVNTRKRAWKFLKEKQFKIF